PQGDALGGRNVFLLGHEPQPIVVAEFGGGGKRLCGAGEVQQMNAWREQEDDSAHASASSATVRIVANRPASAYSVRAMISFTCRVRGSARISSSVRFG